MIAVLDYGIGNLRSAQKALVHVGAEASLVTSALDARGASGVVLPGVGNFGACAEALQKSGLDSVVWEAVDAGTPLLGICVGFQLLFEDSQESPGATGLGVMAGSVSRLGGREKLPQMQWNVLDRVQGRESVLLSGLSERPWFYFVHTYAPVPEGNCAESVVATCDYGEPVVAIVEQENCFGTQFHPEKSGEAGLAVLRAFAERCASHGDAGSQGAA
ncbi:MAG TPA: imidazole glycerol phosphate synthase subunit HisH [Acidimicrobiales bacterium]|nr:imidazole glycerol phosphate synthase subunit HisH [Acidimicrobiales bacterium]